jgi:hypothetical protein
MCIIGHKLVIHIIIKIIESKKVGGFLFYLIKTTDLLSSNKPFGFGCRWVSLIEIEDGKNEIELVLKNVEKMDYTLKGCGKPASLLSWIFLLILLQNLDGIICCLNKRIHVTLA